MRKIATAKWVDLAIIPHFSWPNKQVEFESEGKKIVLQPMSEKLSCTISVFDENRISFDEGGEILYRFLSRLAWSQDAGIEELFILGSNMPNRPGRLGRGLYARSAWAQVNPWDYIYLPTPNSEKSKRALAVYREAMSVNSIPYAFLGYFKILNILYPSGNPQKQWINDNLSGLKYSREKDRLQELQKTIADIGSYLYEQGRCAVAHAFSSDIVNPDSYLDKKRLKTDLCLMKALAALCIEKEFGVMTESAYYQYTKSNFGDLPEFYKKFEENGKIIYKPFKKEMAML